MKIPMQTYLKIHLDDSVAVALTPLTKGTSVHLDNKELLLSEDIPQGHKFALKDIRAGEAVVKYGSPIGLAKEDIAPGTWIHTHNMKTGLGEIGRAHV